MSIDEIKQGNGKGVKLMFEWFRLITPTLVTLNLFFLGTINFQLHEIDSKMFKHLTNDEMHTPRGMIVTKGEFEMHCAFAKQNVDMILRSIEKTECDLKEYIKESKT